MATIPFVLSDDEQRRGSSSISPVNVVHLSTELRRVEMPICGDERPYPLRQVAPTSTFAQSSSFELALCVHARVALRRALQQVQWRICAAVPARKDYEASKNIMRSDSIKSCAGEPSGSKIVFYKYNVTIHPKQYTSDRISGRLRLIRHGSDLLLSWVPYKPSDIAIDCLGRSDP